MFPFLRILSPRACVIEVGTWIPASLLHITALTRESDLYTRFVPFWEDARTLHSWAPNDDLIRAVVKPPLPVTPVAPLVMK